MCVCVYAAVYVECAQHTAQQRTHFPDYISILRRVVRKVSSLAADPDAPRHGGALCPACRPAWETTSSTMRSCCCCCCCTVSGFGCCYAHPTPPPPTTPGMVVVVVVCAVPCECCANMNSYPERASHVCGAADGALLNMIHSWEPNPDGMGIFDEKMSAHAGGLSQLDVALPSQWSYSNIAHLLKQTTSHQ